MMIVFAIEDYRKVESPGLTSKLVRCAENMLLVENTLKGDGTCSIDTTELGRCANKMMLVAQAIDAKSN